MHMQHTELYTNPLINMSSSSHTLSVTTVSAWPSRAASNVSSPSRLARDTHTVAGRRRGREREGGREGREGGREKERERRREGGKEGGPGREGGREGGRGEGGTEEGREGGRENTFQLI